MLHNNFLMHYFEKLNWNAYISIDLLESNYLNVPVFLFVASSISVTIRSLWLVHVYSNNQGIRKNDKSKKFKMNFYLITPLSVFCIYINY